MSYLNLNDCSEETGHGNLVQIHTARNKRHPIGILQYYTNI